MLSYICQSLFSLSLGALLVGCPSRPANDDLITNLIYNEKLAKAPVTSPAPALVPATPAAGGNDKVSDTFSFHAFGDSAWADSHVPRPSYSRGFQQAYARFDPNRSLLGDINYINWETSVGNTCDAFWSPPSNSTYAFLTRTEELVDAIQLGFNLVGMANNHSFDCLRSPEGLGPLQSYGHIEAIRRQFADQPGGPQPVFSGVFSRPDQEPGTGTIRSRNGLESPVTFLSAYVGGDATHCRNIVCDKSLESYQARFAKQGGLRVLALHSWDPGSHGRLKAILQSWLQRGLVDVAVGSGPHIAEEVKVINTPNGPGVLATSLGNFIHPSLSSQPYNIALLTNWRLRPADGRVELLDARRTIIGCDAETCRMGKTTSLWAASKP